MTTAVVSTGSLLVIAPADGAEWDRAAMDVPEADFGHHGAWRLALPNAYGLRPLALVAREGSRVAGVGLWFLVPRTGRKPILATGPYAGYGGGAAGSADAILALHREAETWALANGCRVAVEVHRAENGDAASSATFVLALAGGPGRVWEAFRPEVRNRCRHAEREGISVSAGDYAAFWTVYARSVHALGTPVHATAIFREIQAAFGADVRFVMARQDGRAVAGLVLVRFRDRWVSPWAAIHPEARASAAMTLLVWRAAEEVAMEGAQILDLGRSPVGSGAATFKVRLGARPVPLCPVVRDLRSGKERTNGHGRAGIVVSAAWKRLPAMVADRLGPVVRPWIP